MGGFGGKSDQLNNYNVFIGDPGYFAHDIGRYRQADVQRVRRAALASLDETACVTLSVVPAGQRHLAAPDSELAVIT